jgi:hypothetical protein
MPILKSQISSKPPLLLLMDGRKIVHATVASATVSNVASPENKKASRFQQCIGMIITGLLYGVGNVES